MNITMPSMKPLLLGGASIATIAIALVVMNDDALRQRTGLETLAELDAEKTPRNGPAPAGQDVGDLALLTPGRTSGSGGERTATPTARSGPQNLDDLDSPAAQPPLGGTTRIRRGEALDQERTEESREVLAFKRQDLAAEQEGAAKQLPRQQAGASSRPAERDGSLAIAPSGRALAPASPAVGFGDSSDMIAPPPIVIEPVPPQGYRDQGRDRFAEVDTNAPKVTAEQPVSTFSIDVDTASYAFARKALMQGVLPQPNAVRVEEMINYFPYDYAPPADRETPFATHVEIMPTPWNEATKLLRIGIKGYEIADAERPRANLVFLIDSSGSMDAPDKLPLLINSFRLLLNQLDGDDSVAIVAYAGAAGTVLEPTPASERQTILAALERLHAGGSTAGAEGVRQAYQLAESAFVEDGVNRVILATDGDFNVGITDIEELKGFVERKRRSGVMLSVLGFGQGNYNDELMQVLAQNGNGSAAYIDTLSEARKALVEEAGSTLFPIAKDVKIQIEFNPATVAEYRLIGYETRMLAREDFNNDRVDAGEIGSGHSVTALYELTPAGSQAQLVDDLRYGSPARVDAPTEPAREERSGATAARADEYGFLKIRYKAPDGDVSKLIETPITTSLETDDAGTETRFAAAVAAFGQLLRGGEYTGDYAYEDVARLAREARGPDPFGYRAEFLSLVRLAESAAAIEPLRR